MKSEALLVSDIMSREIRTLGRNDMLSIADDVMKQGRIEEFGSANDIYENPQSDYTRELLEAVPRADF